LKISISELNDLQRSVSCLFAAIINTTKNKVSSGLQRQPEVDL
jgi:hypothetical protein